MATRSTIARMTKEGVESIYCHWDGYPEGVGATLDTHWRNEEKIGELMALGDLSYLGQEIGVKQSFDNPTGGNIWCLAYGRDRGEENIEVMTHRDVHEWITDRQGSGCDYGYLWNGEWWETYNLNEEK